MSNVKPLRRALSALQLFTRPTNNTTGPYESAYSAQIARPLNGPRVF